MKGNTQKSKKPKGSFLKRLKANKELLILSMPGASVLDEFYWLNKHDPNYSLCRATVNRGEDARTDGKFNLSQKGCEAPDRDGSGGEGR